MRSSSTTVVSAISALVVCSACLGREKQEVVVSYVLGPGRPLPEGLKAVAVIDSGVQTQGARQDEREAKWSTIAADMIEAMLLNASGKFNSGLAVANRRATRQVLDEQDLRLAGLVEGETAARAGKLLNVQGLITSSITIQIDVERGASSAVDWGAVLGGAASGLIGTGPPAAGSPPKTRPPLATAPPPKKHQPAGKVGSAQESKTPGPPAAGKKKPVGTVPPPSPEPSAKLKTPSSPKSSRRSGYLYQPTYRKPVVSAYPSGIQGGLHLETTTVEQVRRHLTVQCSFRLMDAATGEAIVQYSPPPLQRQDATSPDFLFGQFVEQGELDPVDQFIGELVEQATQDFVSMIAPMQVEYAYLLEGKGDEGEAGIRALRADDHATALRCFQAAVADEPDEHESVFAMGVTCELMGRFEEALALYRQAAAMEDVDKDELAVYLAAKDRLKAHLDRIIPVHRGSTRTES